MDTDDDGSFGYYSEGEGNSGLLDTPISPRAGPLKAKTIYTDASGKQR